mmetsp:Transcript_57218/g.136036  ORF Transcript_57218/g.136036 Transcript_57218/m.136036 type:complete len:222 (-) Transcript_57218:797-1462(-)
MLACGSCPKTSESLLHSERTAPLRKSASGGAATCSTSLAGQTTRLCAPRARISRCTRRPSPSILVQGAAIPGRVSRRHLRCTAPFLFATRSSCFTWRRALEGGHWPRCHLQAWSLRGCRHRSCSSWSASSSLQAPLLSTWRRCTNWGGLSPRSQTKWLMPSLAVWGSCVRLQRPSTTMRAACVPSQCASSRSSMASMRRTSWVTLPSACTLKCMSLSQMRT